MLRTVDDPAFVCGRVTLIGGVDISFVKDSADGEACASLVVLQLPQLHVVYSDCAPVRVQQPYIPGFLAFREVDFLLERIQHLRATRPDLLPQVILVAGNGILHPRGLGHASHLGILAGIPTIGVGKTLFTVDGLDEREIKQRAARELRSGGTTFALIGRSGRIWGMVRVLCALCCFCGS